MLLSFGEEEMVPAPACYRRSAGAHDRAVSASAQSSDVAPAQPSPNLLCAPRMMNDPRASEAPHVEPWIYAAAAASAIASMPRRDAASPAGIAYRACRASGER